MDPASAKKKPQVKKADCNDEAHRRRRDQKTIQVRKEKREEGLEKKRKGALEVADLAPAGEEPQAPAQDVDLAHLHQYCEEAKSDDVSAQQRGVSAIRRLLSKETHPPVKQVLSSGILPRMIQLIVSPDSKTAFEAAWAVTNIASTEFTHAVVDAGAVRPLVAGMMNADANVRDQCIWCLGNIAGDSSKYRNMLLETEGALQALFLNIQHAANVPILRNATWTLSNFCRGKPSPRPEAVQAILPALSFLLQNEDRDVLQDALWGVSYLTDGDEATIQAVADVPGLLARCVQLVGQQEEKVVTPALRIVGNIISGTDKQTQAAVDAGALPAIVPLLSHPKRTIRREAVWAISNVAAGTPAQIQAVCTIPGLMAGVLSQLRNGEFMVRKEAVWVVSNIASTGSLDHVRMLLAMPGLCGSLCDMVMINDPRMQCTVLETVKVLLERGSNCGVDAVDLFEQSGLLDKLEEVQSNCHRDVAEKAVHIIDTYFGRDEDEEEEGQAGFTLEENVAASALVSAGRPATFGAPMSSNGWTGFGMGQPGMQPSCGPMLALPAPAAINTFNFGGVSFS